MQLFYQPKINEAAHCLDEEESRHCIKVLRLKEGDEIIVLDGKGGKHTVNIINANHKKCAFEIIKSEQFPLPDHHIHIAIAPTKNTDRIGWFVEKAVEIGIHEISFIFCENSERMHFGTDRVIKKAVSAMKQSFKTYLPVINDPVKLSEFINNTQASHRYIAYVDHTNADLLFKRAQPSQYYTVLIGPEGDFSEKELELALSKKFRKVSLGKSRFRTETAGIVAAHILNLINEK